MSAEVSTTGFEPLEEAIVKNVESDGAPDPDFLLELGVEAQSVTKPGETSKEAIEDLVDEVSAIANPEKPIDEPNTEVDEKDKKDESKPESRFNKRISQLVGERKQVEQQLQVERQRHEFEMSQMRQEMQHQTALIQKEQELLRQQVFARDNKRAEPDLSKLTPVERYEREIVEKAKAEALGLATEKFDSRIAQLEQTIQEERAARAQAEEQAKTQRQNQVFAAKSKAAAKQYVLGSLDPAAFTEEDQEVATDLVLAYVAATGERPEVAAQKFSLWLDKFHQGRLKKTANTTGKRIEASRASPKPIQPRGNTLQGESKPSWETLRKNGYSNYVQWISRGSPPLK